MSNETPLTPEQSQLAADNIKLINLIASKYMGNGILFEDLVGYGYLPLCLAARNYDGSQGTEFSTYACNCIDNCLKEIVYRRRSELAFLASLTKNDLYDGGDMIDEYTEKDFYATIKNLTTEEQYIIKSYIGIGEAKKNQAELALELNKERHTVSKIMKNAIAKIKPKKNPQNSINP